MNQIYVVSLEIAKKLHEAGIKIETQWWWSRTYLVSRKGNDPYFITNRPYSKPDEYPAPTLGELVRELPNDICVLKHPSGMWGVGFPDTVKNKPKTQIEDTPENAAGLMLLKVRGK